jgi:hypothetical protein
VAPPAGPPAMTTTRAPAASTFDGPVPAQPDRRRSKRRREALSRDVALLLGVSLLVGSAWAFTRLGLFTPGDDVGYWIGVAGGVMMLVLLIYPLRKYARFMRNIGPVKWWFWGHMTLGIAGPWLILVHSTFHLGSLNAAVALWSMVVVVLSGLVGRFIYVRVHRDLNGEVSSLKTLQESAGLVGSQARSWLKFAPDVEARLVAFEQYALSPGADWPSILRQVVVLPWKQVATQRACRRGLREPLARLAREGGWSKATLMRREKESRRFVDRYLGSVMRVAQYTGYERLFALWHVVHMPFIFLLAISAIVHVVAVHAY